MLLFVDASSDQDALVLDDEGDASKCNGEMEDELGRREDASVSLEAGATRRGNDMEAEGEINQI